MKEILKDLNQAINALKEVLDIEKTDITRDSALLRFQLCFELAWKTIKSYSREEGVECFSPKSCFRAAFQIGIIEYNEAWLNMVEDRNLIVHLYEEKMSDEIYERLEKYLTLFEDLYAKLKSSHS